jgi:hypothetical protein
MLSVFSTVRYINNTDVYAANEQTPLPSNLDPIAALMNIDDNEILFCNTCTLFGVLADK